MKRNSGITLVALVITIIILILLAGVTISLLIGDNGLITKAKQGKTNMQLAHQEEDLSLDQLYQQIVDAESNNGSVDNVKEYIGGVPIPKGFYHVGGTVAEGLVISDNPADEGQGTSHHVAQSLAGNQFVWIPVSDSQYNDMIDEVNQKGKLYNFDENGNATIMEEADVTDPDMPGEMMLLAAGSTTVPVGHSEPTYVSTDEGNTVGITQITLQEEFNKMASSIKKYKGFYIGRFEASLTSDGTKTESKYAVPMMNQNVTWHQMYDVLKKLNTTSNAVTTEMIWGCQWDHMLKTIHGSLDGGGVTYNVGKGHYSRHNTKTNTGENEADKVRNIYDIENTSEITMEANPSKSIRIKRGGDGSAIRPPDGGEPIYSVSASTRTEVSLMGDSYTSRAVLCIK